LKCIELLASIISTLVGSIIIKVALSKLDINRGAQKTFGVVSWASAIVHWKIFQAHFGKINTGNELMKLEREIRANPLLRFQIKLLIMPDSLAKLLLLVLKE